MYLFTSASLINTGSNQQFFSRLLLPLMLLLCSHLNAGQLTNNQADYGLFYENDQGENVSVPLLNTQVEMHVNGLINRVKVLQVFENNSENWINASYLFPLPENAAVDHLRMKIGQRIIIGEIKEKQAAQKAFADAKVQGKKAALIDQQRNNIFTNQVANIAPGEKVSIEIEYQQSVLFKAGVFSLHFPMVITPRYAPPVSPLIKNERQAFLSNTHNAENSAAKTAEEKARWERQWQQWLAADQAAQLARQSNTIITNDPLLQNTMLMEMRIELHAALPINDVHSPYHQIAVNIASPTSQTITLADSAVLADRDFVLNWQIQQTQQTESALFIEQTEESRELYGLLLLMPPASEFSNITRINKEVIFVLDISGSMAGTSIRQAKSALRFAIEQLDEQDTFNIIVFNDNSEFFAQNSLPVDPRSKAMAKDFIRQLKASGGTNMQAALSDALQGKRTLYPNPEKGLRQVVLITDASISNEESLLTQINKQLHHSRLFMVGIGAAPNHYFMKSSAIMGRGSYTHIGDVNQVEVKIAALFEQIANPTLSDINIKWADGSKADYWPRPVKDLYQGEPLQIVMKIPADKKGLLISASRYGNGVASPWQQSISFENIPKQQEVLPKKGIDIVWAKEQIDSIDLDREIAPLLRQEKITRLGLDFHIVTRHTSLLAVEQKVTRPALQSSSDQQIKTPLPQGNTMRLPQTGMASDLYKKIGFWLLLCAALCWLIERHFFINKQISSNGRK